MKKLVIFLFLISVCYGTPFILLDTTYADVYTSHQLPVTDSTLDIGSTSYFWRYIYGDALTDGTFIVTNGDIIADSLRVKSPWIDVTHPDFGATGDGITDDTVAIQAAVDAGNTDGVPVFWPSGVYKCTAAITSGAGTHPIWIGAGAVNTQIYQATTGASLFLLNGTIDGFHISKMTLGTVAGSSGSVIVLSNAHRGTIEDIEIPGMGFKGISLLGSLLNTVKNVVGSFNFPQPSWSNGREEHPW